MKAFSFFISVFFIFSNISAQQINLIYNLEGAPFALQVSNETASKQIIIDSLQQDGCVRFEFEGEDITVDLNTLYQKSSHQSVKQTDYTIQQYEPGNLLEGDLVSGIDQSSDGSMLFVSHRHTGNVFVYDSETYDTLAIIKAAQGIVDTKITDSSLYLLCRDSRQMVIINLTDYSIRNSFPIDTDASQLELSPDGTIAYIGFSGPPDGWMRAYNTITGAELFYNEEAMIRPLGVTFGDVGRNLPYYYEFDLSPRGDQFIVHSTGGNYPHVFDAYTGEFITKLTNTDDRLQVAQYSETGDTLYILTMNQVPEFTLRRIDCNDFSTIDSLVINKQVIIANHDMAISKDGAKVFIPANFAFEFNYYVFDFNEDTIEVFSQPPTAGGGTLSVPQSPDKRYVFIHQNFRYQVFDLETNQLRGDFPYQNNFGSRACAALDGHRLFISKPGCFWRYQRLEGMYVVDYSDPDSIVIDTLRASGDLPEADQVTSAVISNDGRKLYALNKITSNLSIIDVATGNLDTVCPVPLACEKITLIPKSNLLFLSGRFSMYNSILFDPVSLKTVAEFSLWSTTWVAVSSKGNYIYTYSNNYLLSKIAVDGENSHIVKQSWVYDFKGCSVVFVYPNTIMDNERTTFALSPDGKTIVCGIQDRNTGINYVNIIDTETLESVTKVPIEDACTFEFVFTSDSKRVCALSSRADKPIIYLAGEFSYVENYISHDDFAFSAQFNPADSLFYILNRYADYWKVDPLTGEVVEEVIISKNNDVSFQMVLDEDGKPIIRQRLELVYDGVDYNLPGNSKAFDFNRELNTCVIPIPGPDAVCVFNPLHVGVKNVNSPEVKSIIQVYPNPANNSITINSESLFNKIEVIDLQGKLIYKGNFNNFKTTIGTEKLNSGVYFVRVYFNKQVESKKLVIQ